MANKNNFSPQLGGETTNDIEYLVKRSEMQQITAAITTASGAEEGESKNYIFPSGFVSAIENLGPSGVFVVQLTASITNGLEFYNAIISKLDTTADYSFGLYSMASETMPSDQVLAGAIIASYSTNHGYFVRNRMSGLAAGPFTSVYDAFAAIGDTYIFKKIS